MAQFYRNASKDKEMGEIFSELFEHLLYVSYTNLNLTVELFYDP